MGLSNDERGWVMTSLSGIACVLGASIICVDIIVRLFPGKKDFRIQDSDTFLSASLSLSFGVMLFSALYSMLPSAKTSLERGGFSPKAAAWTLIACFLGGVLGIQVISRVIHRFMPSHVVDCEHTHDDEAQKPTHNEHYDHDNHAEDGHDHDASLKPPPNPRSRLPGHMASYGSQRRSSRRTSYFGDVASGPYRPATDSQAHDLLLSAQASQPTSRRPSLHTRLTSSIRRVTGRKEACDRNGPCYGYSDPCGQECFKIVQARGGSKIPNGTPKGLLRPSKVRSSTAPQSEALPMSESTPLLQQISEESQTLAPQARHLSEDTTLRQDSIPDVEAANVDGNVEDYDGDATADGDIHKTQTNATDSSQSDQYHHHHVPTNAFLSIGLQTSIAIALHKLPEGFITYATNHANPKLGFAVFLALFIHNITEGFAMALPLYLAINSRIKAMLWSFVLGGLSQPLGAGVAALWFKLAGRGDWAPSEGVYGGMFAVTAGIMASVALQLFSESLDLTHNRNLCMIGAFVGMGILGVSSALTA